MNSTRNMQVVLLSNSNKKDLKRDAAQWAAKAKRDSKKWSELLVRQPLKG